VQEARTASALNHPGIVTIHDIRSAAGTDFIVMEYIKGLTLDDQLRPRGLRTAQVLSYAVQIADAMAAAHRVGIVHRDLKPSNIMVTEYGRIKILDFGLAKLLEPAESPPDGRTLTAGPLTEHGVLLGTVAYMSPEQAEGRRLDGRSDIFSFGSVLYEMVTSRRPFSADSQLALLNRIVNEDPAPPRQLAASVPPELEKIILRCLRKEPDRRYQTMADLKVALEDVQGVSGSEKLSHVTWRRHRTWGALLIIAAGFFAWRELHRTTELEPLRAVALTTFPGEELYPSFSPDGKHVAFTWTGAKQDNTDIYVQQIGAGSPLRLTTDPLADYNPVWSPDGRWIAFLRGQSSSGVGKSELRVIPPLGGPERKLAEIRVREVYISRGYLDWCPDGTCLVVTDSVGEEEPAALFVASFDTGEKRRLTDPRPPVLGDSNPAISPDGRLLAFRRSIAGRSGEIYWLRLETGQTAGGEPVRLTSLATLNAVYPAWMPDGEDVLFSAKGIFWRQSIRGERPPVPLPFVGEDGIMPAVSRPLSSDKARLVYVRSLADLNIWRVETPFSGSPSRSAPIVSIASTREDSNAQLSPDGRRVAFASNRSGQYEIWLADLDGSNAVQLTSMGAEVTGTPRWSPDGQTIAFDSIVAGQFEVYVIPTSGGKPRRVTSHTANDQIPSFSRDGKWVYFSSNRTGEHQIWKIPATGGDAVQVTHNIGYVAFESPDGAYVYYTQTLTNPSDLWRLPTSGGQPVKVLTGVINRAFTVLERGIYYISRSAGEARLQYFDFASGTSTTVAENLGELLNGVTASPDGRTILYTRVDSSVADLMLVENFR
jgi:Tol biopolymer transport system component